MTKLNSAQTETASRQMSQKEEKKWTEFYFATQTYSLPVRFWLDAPHHSDQPVLMVKKAQRCEMWSRGLRRESKPGHWTRLLGGRGGIIWGHTCSSHPPPAFQELNNVQLCKGMSQTEVPASSLSEISHAACRHETQHPRLFVPHNVNHML